MNGSLNTFTLMIRAEIVKIINKYIEDLEYVLEVEKRREKGGERAVKCQIERDLKLMRGMKAGGEREDEREVEREEKTGKEKREEKEKSDFIEELIMGHLHFYDLENCVVLNYWKKERESMIYVSF